MIGESRLELQETNATDEGIKSYEYDEYQPITVTQHNSAGHFLIEGDALKADNARYADAAGAGKVILSKLAWYVPIVHPNDVRKVNLYKSIAANNVIPVSFRMRQCETFMVYTNQGNQENQGKIREFHVAWKMSRKNQRIRCLVRKNQGNQGIPCPYVCDNLMSGF